MKKPHEVLNNDIFFDVLSLIPVKTLLGLKCISKEWHRIISTRSFVRAQMEKSELIISGFIFQEKFMWTNEDIKTMSYINIPQLGHHNTRSTKAKVHQKIFAFLPEQVVVLASCNGLICCRSCCFSSPTEPTLYICNPTNKEWICLDCVNYDKNESIALAFDPFKHPVDISTKFNLVRVKQVGNENKKDEDELYFTFEIYLSETRSWKKSTEICHCSNSLIKNKGIYIGGILHWLTDGDQVLTFDHENEISWLISAPVPSTEFRTIPEACIGESTGILHYVMVSEEGLHVWYLEDYYELKWALKFWKSLEEIEGENSRFFCNLKNRVLQRESVDVNPWVDPLGFKDGVLLMKVCANLYLYDIEKNLMAEACNLQELNSNFLPYPTVIPYSMSLVPLNQGV